jgi:hypothetical protein
MMMMDIRHDCTEFCLQVTYSAYVLLHIQAPVSVSALQGVQTMSDDHTLPLGTL